MDHQPINLKSKLTQFNDHWSPRVIANLNDYQLKLVKVQGEFVWHQHADTDEMFLVLSGELQIELRDGCVTLTEGELFVVPKGVAHKPKARAECQILLIEPAGVVNTGDSQCALTAANDRWI